LEILHFYLSVTDKPITYATGAALLLNLKLIIYCFIIKRFRKFCWHWKTF